MVRSTLNDFIEQIDQKIFIRVHRSYSVNINMIDDVFPTEISITGIKIPVGKSFREELFKTLGIKEH
jgi:DNA-binding LytR/AlgR family response regulator